MQRKFDLVASTVEGRTGTGLLYYYFRCWRCGLRNVQSLAHDTFFVSPIVVADSFKRRCFITNFMTTCNSLEKAFGEVGGKKLKELWDARHTELKEWGLACGKE
jgi:hypothetical protein